MTKKYEYCSTVPRTFVQDCSSSLCSPPTSDSVEMLNKLKHENDLLRRELISQKEQCKSLSEERDSLKLVVQLLSKDLYKSKLTDAPPPSQEKSDTGTDMAVKVNFPPPKVTHHTTNPLHSPDIPGETTVILGGSIIHNLQEYKLVKEVHHRVVVKSFRGSTTNDINSPERICLHIGTNDLKNKEPRDVVDAIVDLARTVESSGEFKILISELTPRNDEYKEAVKSVNKLLNTFWNQPTSVEAD